VVSVINLPIHPRKVEIRYLDGSDTGPKSPTIVQNRIATSVWRAGTIEGATQPRKVCKRGHSYCRATLSVLANHGCTVKRYWLRPCGPGMSRLTVFAIDKMGDGGNSPPRPRTDRFPFRPDIRTIHSSRISFPC